MGWYAKDPWVTPETSTPVTATALSTGFEIIGGTAVKTLTVGQDTNLDEAVAMSSKAPKASPTLTTPTLGVAVVTSINKVAITAPATSATLTIADGKTLTVDEDATLSNKMNKTGNNLAIGSDADGDMYYRTASVLARLAKGTALQQIRMNAGATVPEWATVSTVTYASAAEINTGTEAAKAIAPDQLKAAGIIPNGTKMLFYADTAPTGWTIDNTLDDKVVFVTKGSAAGGQTGGAAHSAGTWTQPSHAHAGPSHTHTGPSHTHSTSSMTLNTNQIPSHSHSSSASIYKNADGANKWTTGDTYWLNLGSADVGNTGGGGSHEHGGTGASGTGATGADGTGNTAGNATANTWRPAAYCVIICSKN